ncbi:hypothetical protein ABTY94_29800, partial [Streptomyces sp. NPDC096030]
EESGIPGLTLLPGGPVRLDRHPIPAPCHWHLKRPLDRFRGLFGQRGRPTGAHPDSVEVRSVGGVSARSSRQGFGTVLT